MSLHTLANHVQNAGRGEDKVLVHMTPGEVHGLQTLAKAHGGSLTINPETGLAEAGFLSSILPMVAGLGLSMIPGVGPLMAAGIVGGGYGLAKGSLKEGLMAGLGAYGGAGLGAGLGAAGIDAAGASVAAPTLGENTVANAQALDSYVPQVQAAQTAAAASPFSTAAKGLSALGTEAGRSAFMSGMPSYSGVAAGSSLLKALTPENTRLGGGEQKALIRPYMFERTQNPEAYTPSPTAYSGQPFNSKENLYFNDKFTALDPYRAPGPEYKAEGGLTNLAVGGPVEEMSAQNAVGDNAMYPQAGMQTATYSNPMMAQQPMSNNVVSQSVDTKVDPYTGEEKLANGGSVSPNGKGVGGSGLGGMGSPIIKALQSTNEGYTYDYNPDTQQFTQLSAPQLMPQQPEFNGLSGMGLGGMNSPIIKALQNANNQSYSYDYNPNTQQFTQIKGPGVRGMAAGGITNLGDYSDGGRLLRGPGDGVSDSIPASIGNRQPARLADGEFVIPARIVSEIGNGSTEAGARKLYAMMDRVQGAREKSIGKNKVAVNSKADRLLPA